MTKAVSLKNFKKEVIENTMLSLVQFKTEWSGACQIIAPVFESLATIYSRNTNFFTVDIEENKVLEFKYGILDIPTILFFKNGKVIDHVVGLAPRNVLVLKIENALSQTGN